MKDALDMRPGEQIIASAKTGIPIGAFVAAVVLTFVPPFIWGAICLGVFWWMKNKQEPNIFLTNQRIVKLATLNKVTHEILLGDVKMLRTKGWFGLKSLQVFPKSGILPFSILNVKEADEFAFKCRQVLGSA